MVRSALFGEEVERENEGEEKRSGAFRTKSSSGAHFSRTAIVFPGRAA